MTPIANGPLRSKTSTGVCVTPVQKGWRNRCLCDTYPGRRCYSSLPCFFAARYARFTGLSSGMFCQSTVSSVLTPPTMFC